MIARLKAFFRRESVIIHVHIHNPANVNEANVGKRIMDYIEAYRHHGGKL